MRNIILLALLVASPLAFAQDSVDTHGFYLSPGDGDLHDPLRSWQAEAHEQHSFGLYAVGEYAYRPLVRYREVGGEVTRSIEIQDLAALNIGAFYSPHERFALTATAPVYLAVEGTEEVSGAGLGDMRFSAPVGIILPKEDKVSFSLSAVPHLDVPGFYDDQYLQSSGISGGGVFVATVGDDKWRASANAGVQFAPEVEVENLSGNERLLTALSASYAITEDFAVRGEGTFYPVLAKNDVPWTDSPAEFTLSARGHGGNTMSWTAGVSTALSRGVGAATFRGFLGLNWALGAREKEILVMPCDECEQPLMRYEVQNESGEEIDAEIRFDYPEGSDAVRSTDFEDGEYIQVPPDVYDITVTVPDCPKLVQISGNEIILLEPIYFDFDKSTIRFPESTKVLAELVDTLTAHPELTLVEVAGHTDERGTDEYNEGLSQRRMNAVVDYLVEHGIERDRLDPVGYGERQLLDEDCGTDEDCHQLNRRVEFLILERSDN